MTPMDMAGAMDAAMARLRGVMEELVKHETSGVLRQEYELLSRSVAELTAGLDLVGGMTTSG